MSEIKLSDLEFTWRLDSEYYQKSFLKYENVIRNKGGVPLETITNFLIGPFGSAFKTENYTDDKTYRYIRGKDVKPLTLLHNDNVYMPKEDFIRLKKYALRENDILVSVVGTLGNAALVTKEDLPAIFSCKSTVLRTNSINPAYLLAYINSKYGRDLILRKERGAIQKGLNLDDLKSLVVYIPTDYFQGKIEEIFFRSLQKREESQVAYATAENLLLDALGLDANTLAALQTPPKTVNANVKSFSNSFLSSGRLDAEFYQTKYDRIVRQLENSSIDVISFGDVITSLDNGIEIRDYIEEGGTRYLRVTDLSKDEINNNSPKFVLEQAPPKRLQLNEKCLLIARSGTLGLVNIATEDIFDAILSSHIFRVEIDTSIVSPIFLETYFRSVIGQELLIQQNNGGVVPEINHEGLKRVPIPLLQKNKMFAITERLLKTRSHAKQLKENSKQLLELAKRAVEVAIEEGEEQALQLIGLHLNEPLGI